MDGQLLTVLKALADASRLASVGLLAKQPRSVDAWAAADDAQPRHIGERLPHAPELKRALLDAGLLHATQDGR